MSKVETRDFLLEINTEELPAGYVIDALNYLEGSLRDALRFKYFLIGVDLKSSPCLGTKDSLIVYIKDIKPKQDAVEQEITGPPKRIAFDENGKATKIAIGFAKKIGVKISDLKIKATPKGDYVFVKKIALARDTKDILKEIIPPIIKSTPFPKTMKWDDSGVRFARPIKSIVALFGGENIPVKIGNIPQEKLKSLTPGKYIKKIEKDAEIDFRKRKENIKNLIFKAMDKIKASMQIDESLLEEVTFLVNSPGMFMGEFDKKFLELPEGVLRASMAKHQRVFPVSKNGKLINKFIAIIDGNKNIKLVRKNYEKILEAKLKDSLFFLDEDTKKPLSENIPKLKDLIFQKDLGNMFEKIERLKKLSFFICGKLGVDSSLKNDVERAAVLLKADLVTHMVGEFPSLQGVMGGVYAELSGENKEVAVGIREHYLPQGMDDSLPGSKPGAILAISDKIDNIVGFVAMNVGKISGSFDPFGVRRNALGVIRIIKEKALKLDLCELIEKGIEFYGDKIKTGQDGLKNKILEYIKDRIDFLMGSANPPELKQAVLASGFFDVSDAFKRKESLGLISAKKERYFLEAAKVVERTSNILKGAKEEKIGDVDERLFKEDLERTVWKAYLGSKDKMRDFIDKGEYGKATEEYARAFYEILHEFFDKVLVNTEDKAVRLNRLALMKAINRLYAGRIANLALLPQIVVK